MRQQDLDGDVPTEALVLRPPDLAGTADAELPDDRVDADAPAGLQVEPVGGERLREPVEGRSRQEIPGFIAGAQQRFGIGAQRRIRAAGARDERRLLADGNLPRLGKDAIQFFPLRAHGESLSAARDR